MLVDEVMVGGIALMVLVFGLTQFLKEVLGWEGPKVRVLAVAIGITFMAVSELIGILPEPYGQIVEIVYRSLAFGLAASGYYQWGAERFPALTHK